MEKLSPEEIREYRRRLLEHLASLADEVKEIEQSALQPSGGTRFQSIDESIEEAELDVELNALEVEDRLGYEVREALERIQEGSFGQCESCGRAISRSRLDVLPHARRCTSCEKRTGLTEEMGGAPC
jgi:DnaK suppressor protein